MPNTPFPYENKIPSSVQDRSPLEIVGDRYELLNLIGQGSMSRVFRARDRVLDRTVAIKLLREEYGSNQNFVARFYREAHAIALLSSPHLVDIYDYGQHAGTYFIAMQYIEGTDLKNMLRHEGPQLPAQAVGTIVQVLDALTVAHANNIIHRDVKPQNILVRAQDGLVKLTDFGVAHALDGAAITSNGAAIGTAFYMAPEQAKNGPVSPATDIYAVGIVLFELLSGQLPYFGNDPLQVMYQHLYATPPTFASIGANVPPALEQVVQRALSKNPAQRYRSAATMQAALSGAMASISAQSRNNARAEVVRPLSEAAPVAPFTPVARPVSPPTPRKAGALLPLLFGMFLVLLLVVGGLAWLLLSHHVNQPTATQAAIVPTVTVAVTPTDTKLATNPAPLPVITNAIAASPTLQPTVASAPPQVLPPTVVPTFTEVLPTVTPVPTPSIATVQPSPPTAKVQPAPPTATSVPPTPTVAVAPLNTTLNSYDLSGSYKRDDGTLYGRPEVALYGAGTQYARGTLGFTLDTVPNGSVTLVITGIDDERAAHCGLQINLNGVVIFDGPDAFPNAPTSDDGVGGQDRVWGQMRVTVPSHVLRNGSNTLVLSNTTPSSDQIGIPYILINQLKLENS